MKTELALGFACLNVATRARRRSLVVLIYLAVAVLLAAFSAGPTGSFHPYIPIAAIGILFKFFGSRKSPGALLGAVGSGDERERTRWDHAHTRAYEFISWMLVAGLFMAYLVNPNPLVPLLGRYAKTFAENAVFALVMSGLIIYFTLPQAIFLWTEPDMEAQQ